MSRQHPVMLKEVSCLRADSLNCGNDGAIIVSSGAGIGARSASGRIVEQKNIVLPVTEAKMSSDQVGKVRDVGHDKGTGREIKARSQDGRRVMSGAGDRARDRVSP